MNDSNQENLEDKLKIILKGGNDKDKIYDSIKSIIETVPGGSLVSYFYQTYITAPATNRLNTFLESLVEKIFELEKRIDNFSIQNALESPAATTTLMHALQIASRNHQVEKLEALRNAVVNSLLPNSPEEDLQIIFLNLIDRLTSSHLFFLNFLASPYQWCKKNNINAKDREVFISLISKHRYPEYEGYIGIIEKAFPKIYENSDFYHKVFKDLFNERLIRIENLNDLRLIEDFFIAGSKPLFFTSSKDQPIDWIQPVTTFFGEQFIDYINLPTS